MIAKLLEFLGLKRKNHFSAQAEAYKNVFKTPERIIDIKELNRDCSLNDVVNPIQIFMNGIHDVTETAGWSVENWTLKDMTKFMSIVNRIAKGGK